MEQAFYQTFKSKVVDVALQGGNWQIIVDASITTSEDCLAIYGSKWDEPHCLRLYRWVSYEGTICDSDGYFTDPLAVGTTCHYGLATQIDFDNMEKYGVDLGLYYDNALDCALNGNGTPDLVNLPLDGTLPRCWYNIKTWRAKFTNLQVGRFGGSNQQLDEVAWDEDV